MNVSGYRIYIQTNNQWVYLADVGSDTTEYWELNFSGGPQQTYAVSCLLSNGQESPASPVTVR
jgi:hypothetical protein